MVRSPLVGIAWSLPPHSVLPAPVAPAAAPAGEGRFVAAAASLDCATRPASGPTLPGAGLSAAPPDCRLGSIVGPAATRDVTAPAATPRAVAPARRPAALPRQPTGTGRSLLALPARSTPRGVPRQALRLGCPWATATIAGPGSPTAPPR